MSAVAKETAGLRLAADIGGTFTDIVAFAPASGRLIEAKAPTTPRDFAGGVLDAIRAGEITARDVAYLVHGNTVVINAITERTGVTTALVTTAGFRDVLEIGRGNRPDMYNLQFHKPRPFVPRRLRFEVRERVGADGAVRVPITLADLDPIIAACREQGVDAIAICFLHAYAYPQHEIEVAAYLRERLPEVAITTSSDIVREWREFERTSTAVLNAYVQPILDRYLGNLEARLRETGVGAGLFAMFSNGGTGTFAGARQQPIQMIESGPAAGVIGAAAIGQAIGEPNVISLDVGGTTAKCSLIEGGDVKITTDYRLEWTPLSPGYPVKIPVVDIVEIGAGGGSIAWFDDGGALRVGPRSAGADPGPACYGRGGTEPTVTDAMLLAGVLDPAYFLGGRLAVDVDRAAHAYEPIASRLGVSVAEAAAGVIRLANEQTIDALKLISVRRGHDPRDFSLVAFGGGGPMHAAALASELGVKQVIVPPYPGTFSAWGMLMTQPRIDLAQTRVLRLDRADASELAAGFRALEQAARARFTAQGFELDQVVTLGRALDMRYHGQEHTVRVAVALDDAGLETGVLTTALHEQHRRQYTFALVDTPIEIVNFRAISIVQTHRPAVGATDFGSDERGARKGTRVVDFRFAVDSAGPAGSGVVRQETFIYERSLLPAGFAADGPLIVEEPSSTTLVLPDQRLTVDVWGNLVIAARPR